MISDNSTIISKYLNKLKEDNKEFDKRFIPDIIVHERGNNKNNLLLFEIKKESNSYARTDIVKLALIKKYSGLNYRFYIYFEYGLNKQEVEVFYLDNDINELLFKQIT